MKSEWWLAGEVINDEFVVLDNSYVIKDKYFWLIL